MNQSSNRQTFAGVQTLPRSALISTVTCMDGGCCYPRSRIDELWNLFISGRLPDGHPGQAWSTQTRQTAVDPESISRWGFDLGLWRGLCLGDAGLPSFLCSCCPNKISPLGRLCRPRISRSPIHHMLETRSSPIFLSRDHGTVTYDLMSRRGRHARPFTRHRPAN